VDCITVEDRAQGKLLHGGSAPVVSLLRSSRLWTHSYLMCTPTAYFGERDRGRLGSGGRGQARARGGWDSWSPRRKGQGGFDTLCGSFGKVFHSLPQHSKLLKPCQAPGVDLRVKNALPPLTPLPLVYIKSIRRAHVSALEKLVETGSWRYWLLDTA
jgi:hypothetical protein